MNRLMHVMVGMTLAVFIAACGGGGGSSSAGEAPQIDIDYIGDGSILAVAAQTNGDAEMVFFGNETDGITAVTGHVETDLLDMQLDVNGTSTMHFGDSRIDFSFHADGTLDYRYFINDELAFEALNVPFVILTQGALFLTARLTEEECNEQRIVIQTALIMVFEHAYDIHTPRPFIFYDDETRLYAFTEFMVENYPGLVSALNAYKAQCSGSQASSASASSGSTSSSSVSSASVSSSGSVSSASSSSGSIVHNGFVYEPVVSPATGYTWLDRNLGAARVCQRYDDEQCYGDYFQWGRAADGHEKSTSHTVATLADSTTPDHGSFILASDNYNDWTSADIEGIDRQTHWNPCPSGYRIPVASELEFELMTKGNVANKHDAFGSFLKLPAAGIRIKNNGTLGNQGNSGYVWSSTPEDFDANYMGYGTDSAYVNNTYRAHGLSVRCLKE